MSSDAQPQIEAEANWLGRSFVNPAVDYLLIGGGLSLIVIPAIYSAIQQDSMFGIAALPWFILALNSAHFAASTVRLYTKPGAGEALPFVTLGLPLVMLFVLVIAMLWPESLGRCLQAIYLGWSPYHYAAQAYGLSVMYCYRSGISLALREKRLLWGVAMLPFVDVALTTVSKHVVYWLLPADQLWPVPEWLVLVRATSDVAGWLGLAMVPLAGIWLRYRRGQNIPLISLLVVGVNATWFTAYSLIDGFIWATVFHGIQYLAIVAIFHVRDHCSADAPMRSRIATALRFYAMCVVLGYALFNCLPYGFKAIGFGAAESVLLVAATVNIHHFIVDGYIWKLRPRDANRRIVEAPDRPGIEQSASVL